QGTGWDQGRGFGVPVAWSFLARGGHGVGFERAGEVPSGVPMEDTDPTPGPTPADADSTSVSAPASEPASDLPAADRATAPVPPAGFPRRGLGAAIAFVVVITTAGFVSLSRSSSPGTSTSADGTPLIVLDPNGTLPTGPIEGQGLQRPDMTGRPVPAT